MDRKLYVERWLLTVKTAALSAGLGARVRALDRKGGKLLALEFRQGPSALELRYRKRRLGPRAVAAANSLEIIAPVRRVFEKVLSEHRKLLENGFRRFLRKSIQVLQALDKTLAADPGLLGRVARAMGPHPPGLQPALALMPAKRGQYHAYPAVARRRGPALDFLAWNTQQLLNLTFLLAGKSGASAPGSMDAMLAVAPVSQRGVELTLPAGESGAPSVSGGDWSETGSTAALTPPRSSFREAAADVAVESAGEVAASALDRATGAADIASGMGGAGPVVDGLSDVGVAVGNLAEASGAAAEVAGAGLEGLATATDALAQVGAATSEAVGGAAEVVLGAASCLEGADCSGIDLGGLDCSFG